MAFGSEIASFAQGFMGGMDTVSRIKARGAQTAYMNELTAERRRKKEAGEEATQRANRRMVEGRAAIDTGTVPTPQRATTGAIVGGIPDTEEERRRGEASYGGLYAEGGVVRRRGAIEEEDLPPVAQAPSQPAAATPVTPASNAGGAIRANTDDPEMQEPVRDPVRGALSYMRKHFGLEAQPQAQAAVPVAAPTPAAPPPQAVTVPGAAPAAAPGAAPGAAPAAPSNPQALKALVMGEGAESNEVVDQARQRVDPKGEMPLARQNAILLEELSAAYYRRGMVEEGDRAAASLLQNFRRNMMTYGAFAVTAAENGNYQQAAKLLEQAYAYIPDGNEMRARATGDGIAVQQVGGDGKARGEPTVLRGPEAIRNAVGYALDFDNWAKHLLNERTLNENVRLGEARLEETSRHNRASEGLQAASLAESRASRAEARRERGSADEELRATRRAEQAVEDLQARLEDPNTPAEEKTKIRTQDLPLARKALREAEAGMGVRSGGTWSQMNDREQRIELARQRAAGGTGQRDLTFDNRKAIDERFDGMDAPEGMTPEAFGEARGIAQQLASSNRTLGPAGAADAAVKIRRGQFQPVQVGEGRIGVQVGGQTLVLPDLPGLRTQLSLLYREANKPEPQRRTRPSPYQSGIGGSNREGITDWLRNNP